MVWRRAIEIGIGVAHRKMKQCSPQVEAAPEKLQSVDADCCASHLRAVVPPTRLLSPHDGFELPAMPWQEFETQFHALRQQACSEHLRLDPLPGIGASRGDSFENPATEEDDRWPHA